MHYFIQTSDFSLSPHAGDGTFFSRVRKESKSTQEGKPFDGFPSRLLFYRPKGHPLESRALGALTKRICFFRAFNLISLAHAWQSSYFEAKLKSVESRSLPSPVDVVNGKRGAIVPDEVFGNLKVIYYAIFFALRYGLALLFLSLPCAKGGGKISDFVGGIVGVNVG